MSPRIGWYRRGRWMTAFRPDGKGHIVISGGANPPEDIAFDDIVCDRCNADAGADHAGSEGRIFFDGSDSLCDACGRKAEYRLLAEMVAGIQETSFVDGYTATDSQAMGMLLTRFSEYDGLSILRAAQYALEDANFHGESAKVAGMADAIEETPAAGPAVPKDRTPGEPHG